MTLIDTIASGDTEAAIADIEAKNGVSETDSEGNSPLHVAALSGNPRVVAALLAAKCDPCAKGEDGWMPLHAAALGGCRESARALIKAGAEVNAVKDGGDTPLHLAVRGGHADVVLYLLGNQADATVKNDDGKSSFQLYLETGKYFSPEFHRKFKETFESGAPKTTLNRQLISREGEVKKSTAPQKKANTASFASMADGSREDHELFDKVCREQEKQLPDRILKALSALKDIPSGHRLGRLDHALQAATKAQAAKEPEEIVVAALLQDIGGALAPQARGEFAAAVLKPHVSERTWWIVAHLDAFRAYYYAHHLGADRNARDKLKDHPWWSDAERFCAEYDQNCFDSSCPSKPLSFFEPMVRRVFSQGPKRSP